MLLYSEWPWLVLDYILMIASPHSSCRCVDDLTFAFAVCGPEHLLGCVGYTTAKR